tara:strand:+ start:11031 stop:12164 length:1134 start_codon:yes stop_codon:yes gene_type:complete
MLQNKIYQNFIKEILKTFFVILFGLSVIAWTVKAVNFLELIVESGYSVITYFQYSILSLFGIVPKFIPLAFLLALIIFIAKQSDDNELIILWTSGVKKLKLINLFFIISLFILIIYLTFSIFLTPAALHKSRMLLGKQAYSSFLPTIRVQRFSDSFKGFTFLVGEKIDNKIENVFINDDSNILKSISVNETKRESTTIISESGLIEDKMMVLFNGQIISNSKDNSKNDIIRFEKLNLDLRSLETGTIKQPKLQETSTLILLNCIFEFFEFEMINCNNTKNEITTVINRRFFLPFYIPIIALICSFLLLKNQNKKNYINNKYSIFFLSFLILLYGELIIRYTAVSKLISAMFIITPFILIPLVYLILIYQLSKEFYFK